MATVTVAAVAPQESDVLVQQERPESAPALLQALAAVGDRWSLAVVAQLTEGPQRFNDLASSLTPIARTVLSDRLRRLEDIGVVSKRQYSETPARWNYRLTLAGVDLARVSGVLADWAARHLDGGTGTLLHRGCSGEVSAAWHCAECGPVPAREIYSVSN
jgi:DNA-binding HxlR family transcriptional regulator